MNRRLLLTLAGLGTSAAAVFVMSGTALALAPPPTAVVAGGFAGLGFLLAGIGSRIRRMRRPVVASAVRRTRCVRRLTFRSARRSAEPT